VVVRRHSALGSAFTEWVRDLLWRRLKDRGLVAESSKPLLSALIGTLRV
jgi:hypothetical protein